MSRFTYFRPLATYAIGFILIFFGLVNDVRGQGSSESLISQGVTFSAGYYGNYFINPGLIGGAEKPIQSKIKSKRNGKRIGYTYLIGNHAGGYWDPLSHVGLFGKSGLFIRKTNERNKQLTYGISPLSYFRSFLPETYEVDNNGNVEQVKLPGRGYYAPGFTIGFGKQKINKRFAAYQLNLHMLFLINYNHAFLPTLNIEFGYRFHQKNKKSRR